MRPPTNSGTPSRRSRKRRSWRTRPARRPRRLRRPTTRTTRPTRPTTHQTRPARPTWPAPTSLPPRATAPLQTPVPRTAARTTPQAPPKQVRNAKRANLSAWPSWIWSRPAPSMSRPRRRPSTATVPPTGEGAYTCAEVALDVAADLLPPTMLPPSETTHRPTPDGLDAWAAPEQPVDSSWFEAPGAPAGRPDGAHPRSLCMISRRSSKTCGWTPLPARGPMTPAPPTSARPPTTKRSTVSTRNRPWEATWLTSPPRRRRRRRPGTVAPAQPIAPVADSAQVTATRPPGRAGRPPTSASSPPLPRDARSRQQPLPTPGQK